MIKSHPLIFIFSPLFADVLSVLSLVQHLRFPSSCNGVFHPAESAPSPLTADAPIAAHLTFYLIQQPRRLAALQHSTRTA